MKLKYQIPTSLEHLKPIIYHLIACIGLILIVLASSAHAMKPPEHYGDNQCELIAKDYQKEFGGSLIWIQPIDKYGHYIHGKYQAHMINKAYSKERGVYYVDWKTQAYFSTILEVNKWYRIVSFHEGEVFDLSIKRPEFGLIWNY